MIQTTNKEHVKRWVVAGYAAIITIIAVTMGYVAGLLWRMPHEESRSHEPLAKAKMVSSMILMLYESEAQTLSAVALGDVGELTTAYNKVFGEVTEQLSDLRILMADTASRGRIDEIESLLKQKRENTYRLINSVLEREKLLAISFEEEMNEKRKTIKIPEVQITNERQTTDTFIVQRASKGFFKRLAEAFVPVKVDTAMRTNTTSTQQVDSLLTEYDPNLAIAEALINLQRTIIVRKEKANLKLMREAQELLRNNQMITARINILLGDIKYEETQEASTLEADLRVFVNRSMRELGIIAGIALLIILVFLFIILREIGKARELRRRLEMARQQTENLLLSREKLMLMISHDIRAPLSSILSSVELLRRNVLSVEQEECIENMAVAARHTLLLVNDLLDFHRLESGKMEIQLQPFAIPILMEEIYARFKPLSDAKGLNLKLDIDSITDARFFIGDHMRISQAIGNLMSNAIKFTLCGKVDLRAAIEPTAEAGRIMLIVSVIDEGPGIAKAEQEKIYHEFARLKGSESTEGFGLGLSIATRLVKLMNGEILLESEQGEGCNFTVKIPLEPANSESQKAIASNLKGRNLNCLVIDDDAIQLKHSESLLKHNHINVIACSDPYKAINLLSLASFDVILTDIQMPGIDGHALLAKIRSSEIPGAKNIKVVALSSGNTVGRDEFVREGFAGFFSKPLRIEPLLMLLHELFPSMQVDAETEQAIDLQSLTSYASNEEEVKSILKMFAEETVKNVDALRKALKSKDRMLAARTAHKLLPTLAMIKANELVGLLTILEQNPHMPAKPWQDTVEQCIQGILAVVERVKLHRESSPM
ncbi:MAG: response regulator [Tannerellaceae bacterium]|jgi:signal transduction histidine kinase/DNA-binding response OmpR family regulator|nr:response regulator [Tannerellaceae bacterium]